MILIGENFNIMSETIGPAITAHDPVPVRNMIQSEADAGMDAIDLNIGPARKGGADMMDWVVSNVQSVTGIMISLDTTNLEAMEAGLKARRGKGPVLMNSVSLQTSRIDKGLALAKEYNADLIGLLWSNDGMPRDANERAMLAVDLLYKANAAGIPNDRVWIDPIAGPICVDVNQVKSGLEFMAMLGEIAPGCKSTIGISNVSNGAPPELRVWLNRTYLAMLMRYGLYSAILDAFDKDIVDIARGRRPDIVALVSGIMDGGKPDIASLSIEMANYAKTARVLKGDSLYSHSWLEE